MEDLSLFRNGSPQVRRGVLASGLFAFADAQMIQTDRTAMEVILRKLGLPTTPQLLRDSPRFDLDYQAVWDVLFGLMSNRQTNMDAGTLLGDLALTTYTVPGVLTVGGDVRAATVGSLGLTSGILASGAQVNTGAVTTSNVVALNNHGAFEGGLNVGGVAGAASSGVARAINSLLASNLRFSGTTRQTEAEAAAVDSATTAGTIFVNPDGALEVLKRIRGATPGSRRTTLGGSPIVDTGWFRLVAHFTGDSAVNPPYELTYPLGIIPGAVGTPGDQVGGIVDAQLWTQVAGTYERMPTSYGVAVADGNGAGSTGAQLVMDGVTGQLTLDVMAGATRREVLITQQQFRVMVWYRGVI